MEVIIVMEIKFDKGEIMNALYLKNNIDEINQNICKVCEKIGKNPDEITVIAVTKTVSADIVNEAVKFGVDNIGENWVQEIRQKYDEVTDKVKWNMIGHLQTNKVKYIIDKVDMIQSVDSIKLATEISKRAEKINRVLPILIQVNIAGEQQKFGSDVEELDDLIINVSKLKGVKIKGLMLIAPYALDAEEIRPIFKNMKRLYDKISDQKYENVDMQYLSMGMSGDYHIAIEEGSNMVRIGSAIFGNRV